MNIKSTRNRKSPAIILGIAFALLSSGCAGPVGTCKLCEQTLYSDSAVLPHMRTHGKIPVCAVCREEIKSTRHGVEHFKKNHPNHRGIWNNQPNSVDIDYIDASKK